MLTVKSFLFLVVCLSLAAASGPCGALIEVDPVTFDQPVVGVECGRQLCLVHMADSRVFSVRAAGGGDGDAELVASNAATMSIKENVIVWVNETGMYRQLDKTNSKNAQLIGVGFSLSAIVGTTLRQSEDGLVTVLQTSGSIVRIWYHDDEIREPVAPLRSRGVFFGASSRGELAVASSDENVLTLFELSNHRRLALEMLASVADVIYSPDESARMALVVFSRGDAVLLSTFNATSLSGVFPCSPGLASWTDDGSCVVSVSQQGRLVRTCLSSSYSFIAPTLFPILSVSPWQGDEVIVAAKLGGNGDAFLFRVSIYSGEYHLLSHPLPAGPVSSVVVNAARSIIIFGGALDARSVPELFVSLGVPGSYQKIHQTITLSGQSATDAQFTAQDNVVFVFQRLGATRELWMWRSLGSTRISNTVESVQHFGIVSTGISITAGFEGEPYVKAGCLVKTTVVEKTMSVAADTTLLIDGDLQFAGGSGLELGANAQVVVAGVAYLDSVSLRVEVPLGGAIHTPIVGLGGIVGIPNRWIITSASTNGSSTCANGFSLISYGDLNVSFQLVPPLSTASNTQCELSVASIAGITLSSVALIVIIVSMCTLVSVAQQRAHSRKLDRYISLQRRPLPRRSQSELKTPSFSVGDL